MSSKPKVFNPAAFDPSSQGGNEATEKKKEEKEYPTTGNSSRDGARKQLFETIVADMGASAKLQARDVVEQLENEIMKLCNNDPKSKTYRDKTRAIQLKLKGPRFLESRQQLIDGSLTVQTVCSEEFLSGKSAQAPISGLPTSGTPRPGRPTGPRGPGMPRAAPPGQPVRPRGGAPGGRGGFRPIAPRMAAPVRPLMPVKQSSQSSADQQRQKSQTPPRETEQDNSNVDIIQMSTSVDTANQSQNQIVENTPSQQLRTIPQSQHSDPVQEASRQMQQPEEIIRQTDTGPHQYPQGALEQEKTRPTDLSALRPLLPTGTGDYVNIQAELDGEEQDMNDKSPRTDTSALDVSAHSSQKGKRGKKKKKKKPTKNQDAEQELEQEQRLLQMQDQLSQEGVNPPQEDANVSKQQISSQPESDVNSQLRVYPTETLDSQPEQCPKQMVDRLYQVDEVSQAREHDSPNRSSVVAPPPAEIQQLEAPAQTMPTRDEHYSRTSNHEPEFPHNDQNAIINREEEMTRQEPEVLEETIQKAPFIQPLQFGLNQEQEEFKDPPTYRRPLTARSRTDFKPIPRDIGAQAELIGLQTELQTAQKESQMAISDNQRLKEDSRKARYEKKLIQQDFENLQQKSIQQVHLLQAQLKMKEQTIDKIKHDYLQEAEEKETYKARMAKTAKENQLARENMEEQMKSALQRLVSQGGTLNSAVSNGNQIASGVVMSSTQGQGQSPRGASNQQEVQKELQQQRLYYENQVADLKHQLQMRIKDLQRVERQNITLSEQNKTLTDSLQELQIQNLSTVAGSGSIQAQAVGQHHMNSNQQHVGGIQTSQQPQTSGTYAGITGLSSGGQGTLQEIESGDADDGGRDGEARYFNDIIQDEGTGGVRYNQQNQIEAIPQSSSGISGGFNNHSGSGGGGGSSFGVVGHNQNRFAAGGGFDGSYGQLPENGNENSDEEDSEPEREHLTGLEEEDDDDNDEDGYYQNYENVGAWYGQSNVEDQRRRPRDQVPGSQTEMDVGGVHNETGDELEDEEEDDEDGVGESVNTPRSIVAGQPNSQADNHQSSNPSGFQEQQVSQQTWINNHQAQQHQDDDQEGEVEDGSRGEEGGCRESNYAEEEIEQSISTVVGAGLTQDPETEVLPSKGNSQQPVLPSQQIMDNNAYSSVSAGGVVETGRKSQQQHPYEEEEEGGEDIYVQHHHGGNDNEDNEYMIEEEEKGDGANRATKNAGGQIIQGQSQSAGAGIGLGMSGQRQQPPQSNIALSGGAAQSNIQFINQSAAQTQIMQQQKLQNPNMSNEQQQQIMGIFQDESSNGGASVTCQPQTNAVVAAGQARVVPTAPSLMQQTQAQPANNGVGQQRAGQPQPTTSQGRNPRRGNKQQFQQQSTHKSRQGGGAGGNMQRQHQMQTPQQSRSSGRNSRGTQRANQQQQQQFIMQAAPSGEQSQSTISNQQIQPQSQSQQQIVEAPSSQASATGAMNFNANQQQQQQRTNFGMGNQQREVQSNGQQQQQNQSNTDNIEESKNEVIQSQNNHQAPTHIGNAQSSSLASGGSTATATMMQQMPASHASASASAANLNGSSNQNQQVNQAAHAAVNQQKGVVHTAAQSAQQIQVQSSGTGEPTPQSSSLANLAGSGTSTGRGIIPVGVSSATAASNSMRVNNNGQQQPQQQQQEMMSSESGSTAFTSQGNQRNYTNNQVNQPHPGSSPPSTSQTGGGGNINQTGPHQNPQNSAALISHDHQEAASAGGVGGGDADFYIAAVGAPPSRSAAAGITQTNQNMIQQRQHQMQLMEPQAANNSQPQMSSNRQYSGNMHPHHGFGTRNGNTHHGGRANNQGIHPQSSSGTNLHDQQSLDYQSVQFLSGSGEQEEQPMQSQLPSIQSQFGVGGSAASAANGGSDIRGSAANEAAINMGYTSSLFQQQQHHLSHQAHHDTGNTQNHQIQQLNTSMNQQHQQQNQGSDSRKTSGANTPSKDGADTPPYRDHMPQNNSYIHNLTSMKLINHINQEGENNIRRANSASRDQTIERQIDNVDVVPRNMFE